MQKISKIYQKYKIMPQLQEHQFRVAALAKSICDQLENLIDTDTVIKACLIHDMGNILKFDLNIFPEFLKPEGLEYWETVKQETAKKYKTNDEHIATKMIAKELNVSSEVMQCLDAIGFSKIRNNLSTTSFEEKICCYADQRLAPFGVVSIEERMAEGKKRYANSTRVMLNPLNFDILFEDLKQLEKQIFVQTRILPTNVTDTSIQTAITKLRDYSI